MNTIVIIGASGFIGKFLLAELLRLTGFRIKLLSRSSSQDSNELIKLGVEIVEGDLLDPKSLKGLFEEGCTVVNLVYLWDGGEDKNIAAITNLLDACTSANVKRLIHCSTAAVVGRVSENTITEATPCRPISEYGMTKLKIEKTILTVAKDNFDAVILRPTAVFGENGAPLRKLANDLLSKSRFQNFLKSCLFDKRQMNLVCVENVVQAIIFLIKSTENIDSEIFIVSDDDSPKNNFYDVERFLMRELDIPYYSVPRLKIPPAILALLLSCLGRNNVNPNCSYSPDKLLRLGYKKAVSFEAGLAEYAKWYRTTNIKKNESVIN